MGTQRIPVLVAVAGVCAAWLSACEDSGAEPRDLEMIQASRSSGASLVDDDILRSRVLAALNVHRRVLGDGISVNVRQGEVTLSGTVPADQIMRADATAWTVPGVRVVINILRPAPSAS